MQQPPAPAPTLQIDHDRLLELASKPIVARGIGYFKEDRVVEVRWDAHRVWGSVEGNDPSGPYAVSVELDDDGDLLPDCACPFDWEPVCKHAVALLLAYEARQPVDLERQASARDAAVAERARRGRTQVELQPMVDDAGHDGWPSTWRAGSVDSDRRWTVEIRSTEARLNHCSCPDFATNRLGTCKHVEAALHRLSDRPVRLERSVVALDWQVDEAPAVRLTRAADAPPLLDRWFGPDGRLRGDDAAALLAARDATRDDDVLLIGDDALAWAERTLRDAERAARAPAVRAALEGPGARVEGIDATLYPYQLDGVAFLATRERALLADDMGLGKTLQAIAAARWLMNHRNVQRTLVLSPASLKHQWAREIERFTGCAVQVVEGRADARVEQYRAGAPFTVANYELALRDHARMQADLRPDLLVLDEAQRIKNWRTRTADAVKSLRTPYAFVLTGTPLENRLEDLYSLMQVVDPHVLGPLWQFALTFQVLGPKGEVLASRNLTELRRRLAPVMLRRDRTLVRDQLPDRIDTRVDLPLTPAQRSLHDDAVSDAARLAAIRQKRPLTPREKDALMQALQRARMACNAAGLIDGVTRGAPKLDELARLLETLCLEDDHKVVVFSQWERMTRLAVEVCGKLGLGVANLHGGIPTKRRGALIERFREDPACRVFVSTDAGGVGLNLQAATALINLDLPWNPAVLEQRLARVHRLGQKHPTHVFLLITGEGYEGKVAGLLEAKRALFLTVVDPNAEDDVVGQNARLLDLAVDALGGGEPSDDDAAHAQSEGEAHRSGADGDAAHRADGDAAHRADGDEAQRTGHGEALGADGDEAPAVDSEDGMTLSAKHGAAGAEPHPAGDHASATPRRTTATPTERHRIDRARPAIEQVQRHFGPRVEQLVLTPRHLLVILDRVRPADRLPFAFSIDPRVTLVEAADYAALRHLATDPGAALRHTLDSGAPLTVALPDAPTPTTPEARLRAAAAALRARLPSALQAPLPTVARTTLGAATRLVTRASERLRAR